jgi:hypothetical protein
MLFKFLKLRKKNDIFCVITNIFAKFEKLKHSAGIGGFE